MRIAYIIGSYPALTTTFIDREIQLLQKWGVEIKVFSVRKSKSKLSPRQETMQKEVQYLLPPNYLHLLAALIRYAFNQPRAFLGTLIYLLGRPHPTLKARMKTILHFGEGVYLAWHMRKGKYQHIHAHFADRAAILALVASKLLGIQYSMTAHAMDIYVDPVMLPEKISGASFVATCTAYNQAYLSTLANNGASEKIIKLYHGLDTRLYNPSSNGNTGNHAPIILAVGQLKEKKGFTYLLQACHELHTEGYAFKCQIIGEGPLREDLENQIHQLNLTQVVELCGALPHEKVIEMYSQATIFVLPAVTSSDGDRDGIPNVILEALAMQLPVVSTLHSGIPEVIKHGVNGLLVEAKDVPSLAAALISLIKQPAMRKSLGQAGRDTVIEKFDLSQNVGLFHQQFLRLLEEN